MENTSGSSEGHFYYTSSSDVIQTPLSQIPWYSDSIDILFGTMLALGTGVGVVLNFSVFGMFFKHRREFNSRTTWLLMSLALSDGLMALIGGTMFSISSFSHGWPFKDEGCIFYAFTMYATGCTTICHLTIIAIDRALAITTPIKYRSWRKKPVLSAVAISIPWVFGLLLAVPPLAGFQRYTYEGRTSCSIDWLSQAPMDIVYTFIMFIAAYFVPLTIMISCYGIIFTTILRKRMVNVALSQAAAGIVSPLSREILIKASGKKFPGDEATAVKRRKVEIQLAKNFFLIVVVYMLFWSPYAIVSMWGSFGDPSVIPVPARGFPAVLAKFSFIANPLLYALANKEHRRRLKRFYGIKENRVQPPPDFHTPPPEDISDIPEQPRRVPSIRPVMSAAQSAEPEITNATTDTSV